MVTEKPTEMEEGGEKLEKMCTCLWHVFVSCDGRKVNVTCSRSN